ncbi:MAG TPA: methicillin resistance protein, partial [Chloroflexi bacterium]|nr:methicillin resistance protein [Chloroflexota bacterium]
PGEPGALAALWAAIHPVARANGAVFLRVEPNWPEPVDLAALRQAKFRPARHPIQPQTTILIDLRPALDEILTRMKAKWRYNIRLAERKGVTVRIGGADDFALYYELMRATGERDQFGVRPAGYYRDAWAAFQPDRSRFFIAEYAGQPLAALIAFRVGAMAWYLYGASSGRERNRMPNHALQWAAIQWAKAAGCEQYDLWGIPPEVPADRELAEEYGTGGLWGVYRFKQGFGGRVVNYPGSFDFVYSRPLYWAYQQVMARRGTRD